jgi:anti-sigma regulatory factor (Ser/Thr protein kinase)
MELLELPFEPVSASVARRHVVHVLRLRGTEPAVCEDAALIVSELVGNALRHGRALADGRVRVGWQFARDGLRIEVTDGGGAGHPTRRDAHTLAPSGRGLEIVGALSERWGYDADGSGTTVWARLATPTASSVGTLHVLDPEEYGQVG